MKDENLEKHIEKMPENDNSFDKFVKSFYKEVFNSWERYQKGWEQFKVGDSVLTLRAGFGGGAGLVRYADCFASDSHGDFMRLIDKKTNRVYIVYKKENWWDAIQKIEETNNE